MFLVCSTVPITILAILVTAIPVVVFPARLPFRRSLRLLGKTRARSTAVFFAATFILLYGWFLVLWRMHQTDLPQDRNFFFGGQAVNLPLRRVLRWLGLVAALVIGAISGATMMAEWPTFALYRWAPAGGAVDPVFGKPLSFYLFTLPAWQLITGWLLAMAVIACVGAVGFLLVLGSSRVRVEPWDRAQVTRPGLVQPVGCRRVMSAGHASVASTDSAYTPRVGPNCSREAFARCAMSTSSPLRVSRRFSGRRACAVRPLHPEPSPHCQLCYRAWDFEVLRLSSAAMGRRTLFDMEWLAAYRIRRRHSPNLRLSRASQPSSCREKWRWDISSTTRRIPSSPTSTTGSWRSCSASFLYLIFAGPGPLSLDALIWGRAKKA